MNLVQQAIGKGLSDPKYFYKDDFTYNVGLSAALAPAASTSATFNIDGDSDFFLVKTTVFALIGNDGTTYDTNVLPAVTVLITDTTSGRQLMNEAVPLGNIAGTAQLPYIWPILRLFTRKSTIKVDFANISDDDTYSVLELSFNGIKAFYK
jgi:hypothetical protein